jgi:hypothetical protein
MICCAAGEIAPVIMERCNCCCCCSTAVAKAPILKIKIAAITSEVKGLTQIDSLMGTNKRIFLDSRIHAVALREPLKINFVEFELL